MLTDREIQEVRTEIGRYEHKRAASIEALKIVQRLRGWVSDEAVSDIAVQLDMTADELDNVATFYNLIFRKPVGRHVILVCNTISCWIVGQEDVYAHLKTRLGVDWGQTTADGNYTLLPVPCLGACDHAPAMMIDDELYGDLTNQRIDELLEKYK